MATLGKTVLYSPTPKGFTNFSPGLRFGNPLETIVTTFTNPKGVRQPFQGSLVISSDDDMRPYAFVEDSPESLRENEVCHGRLYKAGQNGYTRKSFDIVATFLDVLGKPASQVPAPVRSQAAEPVPSAVKSSLAAPYRSPRSAHRLPQSSLHLHRQREHHQQTDRSHRSRRSMLVPERCSKSLLQASQYRGDICSIRRKVSTRL